MEIAAPLPVQPFAVLAGGESDPCPGIYRFAAGAVVVIDADGGGEVPADASGDGVHAAAEKLKRITARLPKPGGGPGIADIAHRPVGGNRSP